MKKLCKICNDEIWYNGCKYVHGKIIAGIPGIDKTDYDHEAEYFENKKEESLKNGRK